MYSIQYNVNELFYIHLKINYVTLLEGTLPVLILPTHGGMARLSWPGCMIKYKDDANMTQTRIAVYLVINFYGVNQ